MASVRPDARGHGAAAGGLRARACGCKLADGRELIDGMASWWCAIHGYRHPVLDEAVSDQLDRMAHVMFGGLTHEGAIRLAERLTDWTGLDHVFFADSGSVSVEVAIKLVLQYWHGERRDAADLARRLPRRHVRGDGGLRPRRRHALDVEGLARGARLRAAPALDARVGDTRCERCSSSTRSPA